MTSPTYYKLLLSPELCVPLPAGRLRLPSAAAIQGTCQRRPPSLHMYGLQLRHGLLPQRVPKDVPGWIREEKWGLSLARRHDLHMSFVAKCLLKQRMLAEMKRHPEVTKPYDLFCLYSLFVVGVDPETLPKSSEHAREVLVRVGRAAITARILAGNDWDEEAARIAEQFYRLIQGVEESVPQSSDAVQ